MIIELISSNKLVSIFILLPKTLIHKPVTTAINTIASILPLFEKTDVMLLGIILTITSNGFAEFAVPACAAMFFTLVVNKPKFLIINPIIPANANAKMM